MFAVPVNPPNTGFCDDCEVFGLLTEPCWVCGRTDLKSKFPPSGGHHFDLAARNVRVNGVELPIGFD